MTPDEKTIEINGGNVVYEILGETGISSYLTPGGRFSKDVPGLRPLAEALVNGGYRVLLWDRPNCGRIRRPVLRAERIPHAGRDAACVCRQGSASGHASSPAAPVAPGLDADHDALSGDS